jgi:radical SAM-linked protein
MKIRIKFRKYGVMKFIGHLDIMRYFQKAMRRAEIDICYSEGFSPHQIMSFAAPLGVGITSDGEYLDIEVHTTKSTEESIRMLNESMVEGIEITGYVQLPDHAKTAMSIVAAADYDLYFKDGYEAPASIDAFRMGLEQFFLKPAEVLITKTTKKSEKVMDLKQFVYDFKIEERAGRPGFYLKVSTGSADNLKPELVLETLFDAMGFIYDGNAIQIHRRDVYALAEDTGNFIPLIDMGTEIL